MSQAPPSTSDRIQEFYAPCPAQRSRTPQQQPLPRVQQQHTQRHIQLADIAKSTRSEPQGKPVKAPAGSEFESFWSWIAHFMGDVRVKASTQGPINDTSVQRNVPARSPPPPVKSNPNASTSMIGAATSAASKAREADETAKEDLRNHKVDRYSLWGELSYIHKSMKVKKAKKKAEAAMRNQREAAQRAHRKRTKQQVAGRPDAATEEQSSPGQRPTPLPLSPFPLRPPQNIDPIPPDERLPITRKPIPAFSKNEGAVAKHAVKITQLPELHKSVHLTKTSANNYRVQGEADSILDYKRRSSNVTTWGDFMRKSSSPSERLAKPPPYIPNPLAPPSQAQDESDYRGRNASAWTFTVPGEDDDLVHTTQPIIPNLNLNLPPTITESQPESQTLPDPHVCGLCGTLNSPKTHYNAQGIWLCTACRSPTSAKEVPPPPATPRKIPKRYRTRSGPRSKEKSSTRRGADEDEGEDEGKAIFTNGHCECCDSSSPLPVKMSELDMFICERCSKELTFTVSEPEDMRRSMKPEPLRSWHQRSKSGDGSVSPLSTDPFARFDSANAFAKRQSPEFQEIYAGRSRDMGRSNEADFKPPPPEKNNGYFRKDSSASSFNYDYDLSTPPPPPPPAMKDAPLLSSKAFKPPPPPSTYYTPNTSRLSFYPSTPETSPPIPPPKIPLSEPLPPRPTRKLNPKDSIKGRRPNSKFPPAPPPGVPSDFKYAPPPIPDETVHRPQRSSSIYPEDGDGRYTLPALAFAARVNRTDEGKRNTSFYDFWKPILEDRGR